MSAGDEYYIHSLLAAFIMLLIMLIISALKLMRGVASREWKPIEATVIKAQVTRDFADEDSEPSFSPTIHYSYVVGGRIFRGKTYSFKWVGNSNYGHATNLLRGISEGKKIRVYFNPRNPKQSVVIPGVHSENYYAVVFVLSFLLLAVWKIIEYAK